MILMRARYPSVRRFAERLLRLAGKGEAKVIAVFAASAEACDRAVLHVRAGAPGIPIWLFATVWPAPETARHCDRVEVNCHGPELLIRAERLLWRNSVALSVGAWTGERGSFSIRMAPFLTPPFRVLIVNRNGDFFSGSVRNIWAHIAWLARNYVQPAVDFAIAWLLLALAAALRLLARWRALDRLAGRRALLLPVSAASGDDVAIFEQETRYWDGEAIERFARSTKARWILWREANAAAPFRPPAGLPARGLFAVSPQRHFRAWTDALVPMAPFRRLQPEEATRVLAPISSQILVDRAALLGLGIPRTRFARTAWLLLFWRAAAAGLSAVSAGTAAAVSVRREFPLEEAAFLWRALTGLRGRCRPSGGDLARGNIVFAPALRARAAPPTRRPRVLVVSPFLPYPLAHGGAVRIFNLCRALSDRVDFALIAVREDGETVEYGPLGEVFRDVLTVDLDERPARAPEPAMVRHYRSRSLRAAVANFASQWRPDAVQIEFTQMAEYRRCAPDVPAILVEHDLTFMLYEQLAREKGTRKAAAEHRRWVDFERQWLAAFDAVWTVSEADRRTAIREGGRRADRTFTVANGVDLERFRPSEGEPRAPEILFVGSFRHLPNLIGYEALSQEVMPEVWREFPGARLTVIAGANHERFLRGGAADSRITVHGFEADLRPHYARAAAVAVPLPVSAGTNIKVLEAMACGKAIVSTPAGCAGLDARDGSDLLVRSGWAEFAHGLVDVLAQPAVRARLGRSARAAAAARFGWERIAEAAYESYSVLSPAFARFLQAADRRRAGRGAGAVHRR